MLVLIPVNFCACVFGNLGSIAAEQRPRRPVMFFDNVVFAGVLTVGLMVLFFAGFGFFIWKDANKRKK